MRQLAIIAEEPIARRLADHLLTLDVTTRVDRSKDGWIVWVHREEKMDLARREAEAFLANPDDPRYAQAAKVAVAVRREMTRAERRHARNTRPLSGRLNAPSLTRCPVTYALIAISIAVAFLTNFGNDLAASLPFVLSRPKIVETWKIIPITVDDQLVKAERVKVPRLEPAGLDALKRGEVWRLFTPIVLHFGLVHLGFNMFMLYQFGGLIELRKGSLVMLGLVLVTAATSNLGNYAWDLQRNGPDGLHWLMGGMSGVLYALFGYCWMKSEYDAEADMRVPNSLIVQMIAWLFLCMTGAFGPIANAAHVAGLFSGILIGVAPHLVRDRLG